MLQAFDAVIVVAPEREEGAAHAHVGVYPLVALGNLRGLGSASMDDLESRFTFHAADDEAADQHVAVRAECHRLADFLNYQLVGGREKELAITKLEEVMFWANAAIARRG